MFGPFMGGGFPWDQVTLCKKCGRWADESKLCDGHKKGWSMKKIKAEDKKKQKQMQDVFDAFVKQREDMVNQFMKKINVKRFNRDDIFNLILNENDLFAMFKRQDPRWREYIKNRKSNMYRVFLEPIDNTNDSIIIEALDKNEV